MAIALYLPGAVAQAQQSTPSSPDAVTEQHLPSVRDRADTADLVLRVQGFVVEGVGTHPEIGITPAAMQAIADDRFAELAGGQGEAELDFDQLQDVAAAITAAYREAGFIVSKAYLPAQSAGPDGRVRIEVLEGRLGNVIVQGTERYRPGVITAPVDPLRGRILHKSELDTALLYARDLPGVSISSVLQPGTNMGETDLVMVAREADRPYRFSVGLSNHGTELTGRYRAQVGVAWDSPLGLGDAFSASYVHALDPQQSNQGALSYSIPVAAVPGLGASLSYARSEMEVRSGPFAALGISGPTEIAQLGAEWKFVNREDLQMQAALRLVRERSTLEALGFQLSDHRFDVGEVAYSLRHVDRRSRGVSLLQASVRHGLNDRSGSPDLITPQRDSDFWSLRLSFVRMQYLTHSQRLYLKVNGQYSNDVLVPMEQFALGGPDSVRAYPISDALGDRGYHVAVEYHVDAPGFGDKASPFGGRPWREVLQFEMFADHGRVSSAAGSVGSPGRTFDGVGAGLRFQLPGFHGLDFRLAAAVPLGNEDASDGDDFRIWAKFGMVF
ncbi:ShlB/FhaC/HecB family hemolysin secretion/activation protein [Lysobacter sp. A289]